MSDRYPPGVPCWMECADLDFYCELLGWTLQGAVAQLDGRALAGVGTRPEWLTRRAEELRGAIAVAPYDEGPTRIAALRDPSGAPFTVSSFSG